MKLKNSKETILNHALGIFGRLGFHKTTMVHIAKASKRGRRTIYTYFKNKEEVYEAVVEREIYKIIDVLKDEINSTNLVNDKFVNYLNLRMHAIIRLTKNSDALRLDFLNNYKWIEKIRKILDHEEKKLLTQLFELGKAQKKFNVINVDTAVKNIMLIIKGVEFMLIKENNDENTVIHIRNMQHLLLNGLQTR